MRSTPAPLGWGACVVRRPAPRAAGGANPGKERVAGTPRGAGSEGGDEEGGGEDADEDEDDGDEDEDEGEGGEDGGYDFSDDD